MKRIFAAAAAVFALAGISSGAAFAGLNLGTQSAAIGQSSFASAPAVNFGAYGVVNINSSTAKSVNWASITQQLAQLNH